MAVLSERFEDALAFATRLHASQKRKGTEIPYVAHLLAAASLALEHGADEDEAIAALLHDAIEDQGGDATRQVIRRRFGDRVTEIVDGCTDAEVTPKPPWRARKEAYIAHVRAATPSVLLVSASDKLHNARSILCDFRSCGHDVFSRFSVGYTETLWYYRSLVEAYREAGAPTSLVKELDLVVTELEEATVR